MNSKTKMKYTSEKGITLIALVITIIVLLILAGVTISMVLGDDGIIHQAEEAKQMQEEKAVEEEIAIWAGELAVANNGGEATVDLTGFKARLKKAGIIDDENEIGYNDSTNKITLNGNDIGQEIVFEEGSGAQWTITTDNDRDGNADVGDLLTPTVPGLETERFYVIAVSDDETTLTLLAERCIDKGTNKQADSGYYSAVAFDDSSNVYKESTIQGLVKVYVEGLTELGLDLEDVEVAYETEPVHNVKGRLMWKEEAVKTTSPFKDAENYSDILYGTSTPRIDYWLGSPFEYDAVSARVVYGELEEVSYDSVDNGIYGLRPVIKILKSKSE